MPCRIAAACVLTLMRRDRKMKKLVITMILCCMLPCMAACASDTSTVEKEAAMPQETTAEMQNPVNEQSSENSEDITSMTENSQNEADTEISDEIPADEMIVRITVGEQSFTANLHDNETTRALWDMLPQTFPMKNLYGREMCYRMGNGALPDGTAADIGYEIGDISYWPPAGSLVILYKQNGEVFEQVKIGHTNDDISFFNGMDDTEITFEKAE